MANNYNNVATITKAALNVLRNKMVLVPRVNRDYDSEFDNRGGAKVGDTINVRIPGIGTSVTGKVAQPAGYYDDYAPVTLSQRNASLVFSSKELALNVEEGGEFERSVLGPQLAALVNDVELDGFNLTNQFANSTGTPGTAPTDLSTFLNAKATLADNCALDQDNLYCFLNPWSEASMVNGLKGLFQDSSEIAKQYKQGVMGIGAGMHFVSTQNTKMHTVGALPGTVLTNYGTAAAEGMTTLSIDGITSGQGSLKVGDILTVADVYSVNPVSKQSTGQLAQLVVTEAIVDTAGAMAAVKIALGSGQNYGLYSSASGAKQNVTALPLDGKSVKIFGAADTHAGKQSPINFAMHKDALVFCARDLPRNAPGDMQSRMRDKDLGISIRVTKWLDGRNDDLLYRLDVLYGWGVLRRGFGVRVQG